jgi:hypothetical protein
MGVELKWLEVKPLGKNLILVIGHGATEIKAAAIRNILSIRALNVTA